MKRAVFVLLLVALLSGCGSANEAASAHGAGFLNGLWDGLTCVFAFVGNLLGLGDWNIYEVQNNGGWYNLGFLLGVGALGGGGRAASS